SMFLKGMFPGLELTNDDGGVNIRPLPILNLDDTGFYAPHTYHLDARFEMAFTQPHVLADAIMQAMSMGRRVVVEHFDLIYPFLPQNAHLLIGIGEEIIITRPNLFGPEPAEITKIVFSSITYRRQAHSAEDLCEYCLEQQGLTEPSFTHSDVRHGFVLGFREHPNIDLKRLQEQMDELIAKDTPISFYDDEHILIGDHLHYCTGPRMHVKTAGEIKNFHVMQELLCEPITNNYLLVGLIGENIEERLDKLNKITP
ncbi:MAG: alanine-tRNA synthetase second additional domain-containing protein, partial [Clostridia bacterium]|nr:alanine-tRNA synthetase second additional domain-containing protein [Clostridia bacterium]